MKTFSNQSNLPYGINPLIDAISLGNNAQINTQQSFQEQSKEFLSNLEDVLIKQNQNFLGSMETTLKNVNLQERQTLAIIIGNVIRREGQTLVNNLGNVIRREGQTLVYNLGNVMRYEGKALVNNLGNILYEENQAHNQEIKTIIENAIKGQIKNSNSLSEDSKDSKEMSDRSCLSFTFGSKKKEPSNNKKPKDNKIEKKNYKGDFFSVYDSKIQEQVPSNTKTNFQRIRDEFNKTIRSKVPDDINVSNYKKSYGTFMQAKSYASSNLGKKGIYVFKKKIVK